MDKRTTLSEVVAGLTDGMTIGIGGWGSRRKPMALVREILRSPPRDLTIVSYGGPDVGLLCATGKARKVAYGFVSLDSIPLEPHFRAARQQGKIETFELDEGMFPGKGGVLVMLRYKGMKADLDHKGPGSAEKNVRQRCPVNAKN